MRHRKLPVQALLLIQLLSLIYVSDIKLCDSQVILNCKNYEKESLLSFKKGLIDPSGRLVSWTGEDCCKWRGVVCNNETGHVVKLKLRNPFPISDSLEGEGEDYSLGGMINNSLLNLKYLNYLDLSFNNFGGIGIPKFLGSLEKLRYLNLSNANFGGTIPPNIGNLSSLRYLDLNCYTSDQAKNNLQWLSGLRYLEYLNLGTIDLTDASDQWLQDANKPNRLRELHLPQCGISEFPSPLTSANFSSLSVLDLSNNGFNSSIPQWLSNMSNLSYLDLSSNNLHGSIPVAFANMTSLQTLDLSGNGLLGGELSHNLANLCNLRSLDLSANNFSGQITELIGGFSMCPNSKLERLNLGYNNELNGVIPDSIGRLKNLKYIALVENALIGSIPDSIGNLLFLEELYLISTKMSGTPPESMGNLSSLVALDISGIQWEGVMTEAHFLNLVDLKQLSISKDSLSPELSLVISISSQWVPPFKLSFLKLRSCQVGPKFPAWLKNQNELKTFILRNTGIIDSIPDWLSGLNLELIEFDIGYNQINGRIPNSIKFSPGSTVYLNQNLFGGPLPLFSSNVSALYLSNNLFSGPIPLDIGDRLPFLTDIDFSENSLSGSIPMSIGKLNTLTTLVVSNNNLTGTIPEFWENLPFLYVLELSGNSLTGKIPSSLGVLNSLRFLMLCNNHLSGQIPDKLQNCTKIITLDLGENEFSGHIPAWIGVKMSSLLILRLRSNRLEGNIPSEFCKLSSLHIIDLGDNHLSGILPSCFEKLSGMTFDLNTERYEGQLMVVAKGREFLYKNTLFLVNSIDLSTNNLSGPIPIGLTELHRLGTLNLSNNHFNGSIPDNIGRLQRVETFDLSRNQLTGQIPASMTDLTALNHLNLSYNNFWGRIPTSNQFATLIEPSIYVGNPGLCGFPLPNKCREDNALPDLRGRDGEESKTDKFDKLGMFISVGLGFIVGFWGVCGTLIIKKSWRVAYFRFFDAFKDWLFECVIVNCTGSWRIMRCRNNSNN